MPTNAAARRRAKASKAKSRGLEFVFRNGKPIAVILGIAEYQKLLERLEDREDLEELKAMRKKPLQFRGLDEFLAGISPRV